MKSLIMNKKFIWLQFLLISILFIIPSLYVEGATQSRIKELRKVENTIQIEFDNIIETNPSFLTRDNLIQLEIPNTIVWPKIEKKYHLSSTESEITVLAYQYNSELVRFRILFPEDSKIKEKDIQYHINGKIISVNLPNLNLKTDISKYDEKYLENLLKSEKSNTSIPVENALQDSLTTNQSSTKRVESLKNNPKISDHKKNQVVVNKKDESKSLFDPKDESRVDQNSFLSLNSYIIKFAVFLLLILALFYFGINLFKKGFINKGKLSLFHNTDMIKVLSTTYIAPKKALVLVKVQDQTILMAHSDTTFQFITEINNPVKLLKTGEKELLGKNFDTELDKHEKDEKINSKVKLKKENNYTDLVREKIKGLKSF